MKNTSHYRMFPLIMARVMVASASGAGEGSAGYESPSFTLESVGVALKAKNTHVWGSSPVIF